MESIRGRNSIKIKEGRRLVVKKIKPVIALLVVLLLAVGLAIGCHPIMGADITGSGNLETRDFSFSEFTRVEASNAFDIEVKQASSFSISVTADDNLFSYIVISKTGGALKLGLKPNHSYGSVTYRAKITMPVLTEVVLSGACDGNTTGFSSSDFSAVISGASSLELNKMAVDDICFDISGASDIRGDITADNARLVISGAGYLKLSGLAKDIVIDASGASSVDLSDFQIDNAHVSLSGASNATVNVDGQLNVDLSGASLLEFIDEPTLADIDVSGSSTLRKK